MLEVSTLSEADIHTDAIAPGCADMPVEAARSVLNWKFSDSATRQMRLLLDRNNKGLLTPSEQDQLEKYRRVGLFLDLVQAKARVSLKRAESSR